MENILEIKRLSVSYQIGDKFLKSIDNIDVHFELGKVTGLIGESGCGKSTMINSVMGVLAPNSKISPESEILFLNEDLLSMTDEDLRKFRWMKASMVFQAAQNAMNPTLKISEQLMDSIYDHDKNITKKAAVDKVVELLNLVKLDPDRVFDSYPHELSGGMRQRVIIAMAMVLDPELIILDEPTTALDVITQSFIFDILVEIQNKKNLSMILITHDIALSSKLAHNMIVMYGGEVFEIAETETLFDNPLHPYTIGLLDSMPFIDGDLVEKKTIKGSPPDLVNKTNGCVFAPRCPFQMPICLKVRPDLRKIKDDNDKLRSVACHKVEDENDTIS